MSTNDSTTDKPVVAQNLTHLEEDNLTNDHEKYVNEVIGRLYFPKRIFIALKIKT